MKLSKAIHNIHISSNIWLAICTAYVLVYALRQAGVNWWIIFSLSGQSTVIFLVLISFYLFAIFHGVSKSQKITAEHPLTSTDSYMILYCITPFLGTLAGIFNSYDVQSLKLALLGIAYGTLGTTFVVWIIFDPVLAYLELLLPACRRHRSQRLEEARQERERIQREREILLEQVEIQEKEKAETRTQQLTPLAQKLATILKQTDRPHQELEYDIIDIGIQTWQMGGLDCMQHLHDMALQQYRDQDQSLPPVDYISQWWDGIGGWIHKPFCQKGALQKA